MKSKLFEEAIADAKAVRATALANAKSILEEAFTPKLKSMLGAKLREELGEDEEGTVVPAAGVPAAPATHEDESVTSEEIDEILKELDSDAGGEGEDTESDLDSTAPAAPTDPTAPAAAGATATTPVEGLGDVKTVEAPALVVAPGQLPVAGGAAPAAPSVPSEPSADAGTPVAPAPSAPGAAPGEGDEEINLEELLAELSGASDMKEESVTTEGEEKEEESVTEGKEKEEEKGDKPDFKKQFDEACETVKYLRDQLNEVNLLNAKLLYTNKLFKAHALNNPQKMKIIESFDLAKSVREVKLTFNNLSEALNFSKAKSAPAKKAITEGFASQSVGTTKPSDKIVVAPVNEMASRFQKLAGIKKK